MGLDGAILLAALAAISGVAVLRYAWSQPERSLPLNLAGWGLLVVAALGGAQAGGAWGVAVASLFAMGAAAIALAVAASQSERKPSKASNRRVNLLPEQGEKPRIGGRVVTFLITVPLAFAASVAFVIGLRAAALSIGWSEADANATALFAVPIVWGILAYMLLMRERRMAQVTLLALSSLAIVVTLIPGA